MITSGISSSFFAILPQWYNLPLAVKYNMNTMAICSSVYHIYDNNRQLTSNKNNTMRKVVECLDGMAIITCCGHYWLPENTVSGLIGTYVSMKLMSNIEFIKQSVYFSTIMVVIKDTPITSIPCIVSTAGLYHYFKYNQIWNHFNRTVWHLGNSILITIAYLHKYTKK